MSEQILQVEIYTTHGRKVLAVDDMTDEQRAATDVLLGGGGER